MDSEDVAPQLEEAGPLLELLLQHLQALFGGGAAALPAGLAFVCTDRQRDPVAAAAVISACWRALALRQVVMGKLVATTPAAAHTGSGGAQGKGWAEGEGPLCEGDNAACFAPACPASLAVHAAEIVKSCVSLLQRERWLAPPCVARRCRGAGAAVGGAGRRKHPAHRWCAGAVHPTCYLHLAGWLRSTTMVHVAHVLRTSLPHSRCQRSSTDAMHVRMSAVACPDACCLPRCSALPAVEAALHDPAGLEAAAAAAGTDDLRNFVFIASMVGCWAGAGSAAWPWYMHLCRCGFACLCEYKLRT